MFAIRDSEGRFVGRSRTRAGAHRATRTRNRAGATVERSALGVGMTVFGSGGLKIHHFRGSVRITDLTNAGKRGKKVREMSIIARTQNDDAAERMFEPIIGDILGMSYDEAKQHLERTDADHQFATRLYGGSATGFTIHEVSLRGVDVEPPATKINLEKKHDDGTIVTISASPHEFLVKDSTLIHAPGKVAHGHRQDTSYWPSGSEAQKRRNAGLFYEWLRKNLREASNMTIVELTRAWGALGVGYDSH